MKWSTRSSPWLVARAALALGGGAIGAACLPGDSRPEPASIYLSAEPSASVAEGFTTADGWSVSFTRLLVALGDVDLDFDDACNVYAEANYDRLFDFTVAEQEKVGTAFGLGDCELEFRVRAPSYDAILGPGATRADVESMRIEETDRFADEARTSVFASGVATREGVEKRFTWSFRRSFELTDCPDGEGRSTTSFQLETGQSYTLRVEVRGEELFRAKVDDDADFVFQPLADADADGDGDVTLLEMSMAPRPAAAGAWAPQPTDQDEGDGPRRDDEEEDVPTAEELTLEHYVYDELLPRLTRMAGGGRCATEVRDR